MCVSYVLGVLNTLFEDKRLAVCVLIVWLFIVVYTFSHLGLMQTQFVSFGPSEDTYFMGIQLATWPRWTLVAIFTFLSTAINDFVGDALVPFITNAIQDHKTQYLPYSKMTCWAITQALSIYGCTMSIFSIYILLSQLDFMLIRMLADSLVNMFTMYRFMKHKRVNKAKYDQWKHQSQFEDDEEAGCGENKDLCKKDLIAEHTAQHGPEGTDHRQAGTDHGVELMVPMAAVIMREELEEHK